MLFFVSHPSYYNKIYLATLIILQRIVCVFCLNIICLMIVEVGTKKNWLSHDNQSLNLNNLIPWKTCCKDRSFLRNLQIIRHQIIVFYILLTIRLLFIFFIGFYFLKFSASIVLIFCFMNSISSLSFWTLWFISSTRLLPFLLLALRKPRLFS